MPARKGTKSPKLKGQGRKGKGSAKSKKKKSSSAKSSPLSPLTSKGVEEVDILSPAAMTNAYYICHNAPDCLEKRGFGWSGAKGGKKGKKGKKKKKK
uniref:Small lysine-rich protein 1-like n=1 Tax=Ciona intestinalis TaxID=7719 RepID=H2XPR8_CIOIN|nr:small lysine-rich protein 1-like [Ciona intestinalis]|eukprot:XP_009859037.1 small lysine-rich protein 1-like [Ciona intestinalis]